MIKYKDRVLAFSIDFSEKFSGAIVKLRKSTTSFVMSVCLSVRMEQLGFHWTGFHETFRLSNFRKIGQEY
jgi:hypothetical protein